MGENSVVFEETISFHQARERLRERLRANDFEFRQWIQEGRIELYCLDLNHRCTKLEHERTGAPGSLPEHPEIEQHLRDIIPLRRFLREEIESFDPARENPIEGGPDLADYPFFYAAGFLESDDFGYNPSGRSVSYQEVIEFLSKFAEEDEVVEHLRLETVQDRIHGYGLDSDDPSLEESYFPESELVALATVRYGRKRDGWDAVTRERASTSPRSDDVPDVENAESGTPDSHVSGKSRAQKTEATIERYRDWEQQIATLSRTAECTASNRTNRSFLAKKLAKQLLTEYKTSPEAKDPFYETYGDDHQKLAETIRRGRDDVPKAILKK